MDKRYSFDEFVDIIRTLLGENGCPWDKAQTHESLKKCLIEECYEVLSAIDHKDQENLCEELGDVLMQVVFHAQLAKQEGSFDLYDVIDGIAKKMVRRHPHIFGEEKADTAEEVLKSWEEIKKKEKKYETKAESMETIPIGLPALMRAEKVQGKAADTGFDFPSATGAIEKVKEEFLELSGACEEENGDILEEFGDVLFSMVNLSRFLKINPEFALTKATEKFITRFKYVESCALKSGKQLNNMSLEELDVLWNEAKARRY